MATAPILAPPARLEDPDQRVILNGIDWWQRGNAYVEILQSVVIPGLAPSFIRAFLDCETQAEAVRKMRDALRS